MVKLKPSIIKSGGCVSNTTVEREMCAGKCASYQTSYIKLAGKNIGNKECRCCGADKTHTEKIEMTCNGQSVSAEYVRIDSCKCNTCAGESNSAKFTNDLFRNNL